MFGNDCTSHANDPECAGGKLDSVGKFSWYQLSRNEIGCDNPCFEQFSKNTPFSDYLFTGVQIAKVPGVLRPRSARKIWAASDKHGLHWTARTGVCRQVWDSPYRKQRLAAMVGSPVIWLSRAAQETRLPGALSWSTISTALVAGACGEAAGGCEEMRALPSAACLQTLLLIVAVTHGDQSDQRRAEHEVRIGILRTARSNPSEHLLGHHLGHRHQRWDAGRRRQWTGHREISAVNSTACGPTVRCPDGRQDQNRFLCSRRN